MTGLLSTRSKASTLAALAGLLGSCSVYAPLQPSTPLLHAKGEAEVIGSAYLSGRLEGSVAYSPLKHVLVRVAGGQRTGGGDSTYFRIRQAEAGVGTYGRLAEEWLIGASVGYGLGTSGRRFEETRALIFRPDPPVTNEYKARFEKVYADGYIAYEGGRTTIGGAYRLSQVRFSTLTNNGVPVPMRRMTRLEPMLFLRFGNTRSGVPWVQGQLATSISVSSDYLRNRADPQLNDIKEGRLFTSIGLVLYPHRFKREPSALQTGY